MSSTGCGFKKMTQHQKCDSWKFLCQILYTCLAGSCPFMCCFSLKLLYVYEIGIMPNFKFEFCNCTSLFVMWCYVPNNYLHIYWTKMEVGLHKIDTYMYWCAWSVTHKVRTWHVAADCSKCGQQQQGRPDRWQWIAEYRITTDVL